ncbi:MATE family efflux transporter [Hominifimenecus sp. rT4P-3]|uniref:MATE family efflux transporter n=1 Tax=Hominifimenecus sp. rT4P-3 TaxID=3242979 RepID=UPI003DA311A7
MTDTEKNQQDKRKNKMMTEPISKVIPKMAIPTIVAFLITSIYNLADTYFVSSLGTNATAAVSVNASLDQIIMMAGSMLAVGANSYIARLLGAREEQKASRVLSTAFFLAIAFGAVVMVLGLTCMQPMVRLLGATDTCEQYSIQYATYVVLVAPFMAASFVMNQCLRAEGSAVLSMIGMGFGGILNCILDPIFIFGLDLGVAGASMATAISKLVSFAILIFPYLARRSILRISLSRFQANRENLYQIVSVGSSSMFRSGLGVVSGIVLNNIAGNISDAVLAGIGISNKIMMFPFGFILGFGSGFQPVAGFNWGAKRYDRVMESYRFSSRLALIGAAAMGLALGIFARPVIYLFSETDPAVQSIGALCIRLQCLALPVHGWVAVVNMFCAGLGDVKGALLLSTARQGSCFLPIVLPMAWLWGEMGVASVQAVADVLSLFLAVPIIRRVMRMVRQKMEEYEREGHPSLEHGIRGECHG